MDLKYWEAVGSDYEQTIFDSARNDKSGVIRRRLDAYADPKGVAIDFGCGVGHYLPLLASRFRTVYGLDFSDALLERARRRCARLDNVTLQRADLASGRARRGLPRARFGVCANVLISEDAGKRRGILRSIHRQLAPNGHVLLLVPSLESALFANARLVEWNRRLGWGTDDALAAGMPPTRRTARELLQGLVRIEDVPTKHYLREEVIVLLEAAGFRPVSIDKTEYAWSTEFDRPPKWMRRPGPWDWVIVAKRRP